MEALKASLAGANASSPAASDAGGDERKGARKVADAHGKSEKAEPKRRADFSTRSGFSTAAVLMLTLSAPALRSFLTSSIRRTPPPTVSGMKTWSATRSMTSTMVSRASEEAVMSRNATSSAPASS